VCVCVCVLCACAQFFANPTGSLVWIKCDPFHKGHVAILGDAAHAMVPFYGQVHIARTRTRTRTRRASRVGGAHACLCVWWRRQGMNCCFEDVRVLDELLDKYDDDWDQVPSFILNSSLSLSL
jgi:2-polyprenyl-6-methoxyphenol hydroxylase-like FAD-dependent oxidoreductase